MATMVNRDWYWVVGGDVKMVRCVYQDHEHQVCKVIYNGKEMVACSCDLCLDEETANSAASKYFLFKDL